MLDIDINDGKGKLIDSDIYKATNLLETPINHLYYQPDFGLDYDVFFNQDFDIQFETFKSIASDVLVRWGVNVINHKSELEPLYEKMKIYVGSTRN
jgi:hypothetical protein